MQPSELKIALLILDAFAIVSSDCDFTKGKDMMLNQFLKKSVLPLISLICLPWCFYNQASLASQPKLGTVQSLVVGDRACYVELVDDAGQTSIEFAAFEICTQDLVGKRVSLIYKLGNIQAESCQGNPDCNKSEKVMLIIEAQIIDP
jgi:hypothetical protein